MKKIKISEWLEENINSHSIYEHAKMAASFEKETGFPATWPKRHAGELMAAENAAKVGPKGIIEMRAQDHTYVCTGYIMAEALAHRLCKDTTYQNYNGRGFSFRAAVEDLKKAGF